MATQHNDPRHRENERPGLTGDPHTSVFDAVGLGNWVGPYSGPEPLYPDVEPLNLGDPQMRGLASEMRVPLDQFETFFQGLPPEMQSPFALSIEQQKALNEQRREWFENWRKMTGDMYNQSLGNLQAMRGMNAF